MAPPPFRIVGDRPKPMTVQETAKALRVSPQKLQQTLTALRVVLKDDDLPPPRQKASTATDPTSRAKAAKARTAKAATARRGRKPATRAARSRG